jgi:hypothetical protein
MHGVFQPIRQKSKPVQTENQRLLYCGTCKTIGKEFGSLSRFFLHSDLTFLGEILISLTKENPMSWDNSYLSYNCLRLPKTDEVVPQVLKITSILNLFLWKIKLEDAVIDEGKWIYKKLNQYFEKEMASSRALAISMGLDPEEIESHWIEQIQRETFNLRPIEFYSEPTEKLFETVFRNSVKALAIVNIESFSQFGKNYGKLVYLLDAWEDYEKDYQTNSFNAIRVSTGMTTSKFSKIEKSNWQNHIISLGNQCKTDLKNLNISEEEFEFFSKRIDTNLKNRLGIPNCKCSSSCKTRAMSWGEKWKTSINKSKWILQSKSKVQQYVFQPFLTFIYMMTPYSVWADDSSGSDACSTCIGCICMAYCCSKVVNSSSLGNSGGDGCCCCRCCSDCCVGCAAGCCISEACC